MSRILIKAIKPHRQKILVDGKEMKLQQWANRKAAGALRDMGGDVHGEQFTNSRDNLMRDAVMNPENYGIKFVDREAVPFEGQELSPELSEPDIEGEKAEIDAQFAPDEADAEQERFLQEQEERTYGKDESEIDRDVDSPGGVRLPEDDDDTFSGSGTKDDPFTTDNRDEDPEEEHMKRIMTSHNTAFRDAWSILKSW